jgi:hypothetical protein
MYINKKAIKGDITDKGEILAAACTALLRKNWPMACYNYIGIEPEFSSYNYTWIILLVLGLLVLLAIVFFLYRRYLRKTILNKF